MKAESRLIITPFFTQVVEAHRKFLRQLRAVYNSSISRFMGGGSSHQFVWTTERTREIR
jgi:hypothetical protein